MAPGQDHHRHGERRGTMCTAKDSDTRPGVAWFPPRLRGRCGTMCTAKASDVRLGSLGLRRFAWQAWDNLHICTSALPRGRIYALASLALASLGLRLVCVPGVGQCAPPRGRIYALASLGLRSFAWQAWDHVHCQRVGCTP